MPDEPARPLGAEGRRLWAQWADRVDDTELLLTTCETADERMGLRVRVFRDGKPADHAALRELDRFLATRLDALRRSASWRTYANPA